VHCDVPELNEKMDRAATILNLKKHIIGAREGSNIRLSSPGDLEGHLGLVSAILSQSVNGLISRRTVDFTC
jgi:hypothetical protein